MHPSPIELIPLARLAVILAPVALVVAVLLRWRLPALAAAGAVARMVIQLLGVGFVLVFIFETDSAPVVALVLGVMVTAAAWIALRTVPGRRRGLYGRALLCIACGGGLTFAIVLGGVLDLDPWYAPRYAIPLAGMVFANAMTSVSLAAERHFSEIEKGVPYEEARRTALGAALIPITNSMLAVGLVALPGMMTGQILSGVDPLMAVRYQILVMCMIYAACGLAAAAFLRSVRPPATIQTA